MTSPDILSFGSVSESLLLMSSSNSQHPQHSENRGFAGGIFSGFAEEREVEKEEGENLLTSAVAMNSGVHNQIRHSSIYQRVRIYCDVNLLRWWRCAGCDAVSSNFSSA